MITNLEPDILKCKLQWAFGSISTNKANGGDRISVELFQILKDDAVKVLNSRGYVSISMSNMEANVENSAVATGLDKVSFHSNP